MFILRRGCARPAFPGPLWTEFRCDQSAKNSAHWTRAHGERFTTHGCIFRRMANGRGAGSGDTAPSDVVRQAPRPAGRRIIMTDASVLRRAGAVEADLALLVRALPGGG